MRTLEVLQRMDVFEEEAFRLSNHMDAKKRFADGNESYGEYNPATDSRDLFDEMRSELLDTINYCHMQLLKLELAKNKYEVLKSGESR